MTKKPHPGPFNGYAPSADVNGSYVYVVRRSGRIVPTLGLTLARTATLDPAATPTMAVWKTLKPWQRLVWMSGAGLCWCV